jgi:hypothetical protein
MSPVRNLMNYTFFEYLFKGKIFKNKNFVDNLNFKFTIDKINPKRITGIIIGRQTSFGELKKFWDSLEAKDISFSIKGLTEDNCTVEIQKCVFKRLKTVGIPERKYEIEKEVAELEAYDFHIERKFEKIPKDNLNVINIFKINTRGILDLISHSVGEESFNGSMKIHHIENPKEIITKIGQLKFYHRYDHLRMNYNERKGDYRYYSCAADIETKSVNSRNYHKKIKEAKKELEDYLHLISFVSRKRVKLYQCTSLLYTEDTEGKRSYLAELEYFEKNPYPEEYPARLEDCIIFPDNFDEFIKVAYPEFIRNKDSLKSILDYYITAQEEKLLESSFLILFVVLEALVYQFSPEENVQMNLQRKQFKELTKKIKPIILKFCDEEGVEKDLVLKKLPELQRVPIKENLERLIEKYEIYTDDLYPVSKEKFKFIKMRNNLIHKGKISDYYEFFKDKRKLQILVERIILRILGWEKRSYADIHLES